MIGAIIGDIIGSVYEFRNTFDYDFPLFTKSSTYTDDTICTIAVADAILRNRPYKDSLLDWCRRYPHPMGGYGVSFARWLRSDNPQPYDSFGNGAAMRVSPVGWAFNSETDCQREAIASAACSHSHAEGIIGALSVARMIRDVRLTRFQQAVHLIRANINHLYRTDWEKHIPKKGVFDETCQGCVPLAAHIVLQSNSFEDAVRKAVSYGGDSDTVGAIGGSIAEPMFGIPKEIEKAALSRLPDEMLAVVKQFKDLYYE